MRAEELLLAKAEVDAQDAQGEPLGVKSSSIMTSGHEILAAWRL